MFTGIITGVGRIADATPLGADAGHGLRLTVQAPAGYLDDVTLGDSIALNGACMTVTSFDAAASRFTIDISAESLDKTAGLGQPGPVNLEKALRANDRLGGHLVSGHVDGIGEVVRFEAAGENRLLAVRVPAELARYVVRKGSIAVNGVSLTVNAVGAAEFDVNLIPHTLAQTNLAALRPGARANLEIDMIARYIERMMPDSR